ncbi:hypothetical protein CKM354_000719600 [Cercospora kikuchii]|uniref:Uncharacterized protein n=1 Tax=Cercospora kikuchii TaxID=84275 RepID=A0A9P3CMA4_9PEZI|nr:uncharacterized protein CKM354_000719600 [Cercospora kikuchii]GIZ43987.1 hypothetical protein CKM354_000719600 [Cercospora kikuchii]
MGKTKNSRRIAAKGGKAARGMVVLPVASSSRTGQAASRPESSTTSNAPLPPPINDDDSTQEETSERDHNTTAESKRKFKMISKEQKEFLNKIQFALYTPSTNLHDFFSTIEDEHLPAAIEHIEFLHGQEVEEQLNRNQSRLPEDHIFSLPPPPHDPEDLDVTRTHLVDLALRLRRLRQLNAESIKNAPFASNSSPDNEPENRPREALDKRTKELTTYICDVCGKYISLVRFACVKKVCKLCSKKTYRNAWCSKKCWEVRRLGSDDYGGCKVEAVLVGHVGVEEDEGAGDGEERGGNEEREEGGDEEGAVRGAREWRVVEGEKGDERGRKRYELKRVEGEVDG